MLLSDTGGREFEQPPVGSHIARCIKVIDLGTQKGEWQGKATFKRQVVIGWELPNEFMSEGDYAGKPFVVSRFYTASLSEKANLRADLVNWRGREFSPQELAGFDAKKIVGTACMLSLTPNDKGKVRVTGVMAAPKGIPIPAQINDSVYFSLEPGEFDLETFDALSDGFKKMIVLSPEYQTIKQRGTPQMAGSVVDGLDDDIPF